jgi:hypothetical protein
MITEFIIQIHAYLQYHIYQKLMVTCGWVSLHVDNIGSLDDVQQFLSDRRKQWKAKHEHHDSHGNVHGHGRHKVEGKKHGGERYDPASKEDEIASNTVDGEMEPEEDDEEEQGHCRTPAGD